MEKKTNYYFGFYRDHSVKGRHLVCQVTDNIDSLSCELLGGIFPLLELSLTRKERDKVAYEIALQYGASYIETGSSSREKVSVNNQLSFYQPKSDDVII